jgi:peptidase M1-like protein
MKRSRVTGFLLGLWIATVAVESAVAAPETLTPGERDTLALAPAPHARTADAGPSESATRLIAVLDAAQSEKSWALRIAGEMPEGGWDIAITINDQPLFSCPVPSPEGSWHLVPPAMMREGENIISISSPTGETLAVTEVEGISLENAFEEAHFARVFGEPTLMVQPPTDPAQDQMDVLHCDLALVIDMTSTNIPSEELTLTAENLGPGSLSQCVLDFDDNGGAMVVSAVDDGVSTPLTFVHDGSEDRLLIDLPSAVPAGGQFTVRVHCGGTPNPGPNAYRRTTHSGVPLVETLSQPYGARTWWPCKDVPDDKFTIDMHFTCPDTVHSGYPLSVASNGSLVGIDDNGDGTRTFHWSEAHPLSSYLVSIACTNYREDSGVYTALSGLATMEVAHQLYPELWASEVGEVARTIEVIEFFAQTFGEYPFLSEKYWIASFTSSGMEHQTCTSLLASYLATPYHRINVHEISHQWFGDLITCAHSDHLWIHEGWAMMCEALWDEHHNGTASYHSYVSAWYTDNTYPLVSGSADGFYGGIIYRKGGWVLHMLRRAIGDTAFFAGANSYIADPALRYGNALSDDLQGHFETASGQDLAWFFDQWLHRRQEPDYSYAWSPRAEGADTVIDLTIEQTQDADPFTMPIDFRVSLQSGSSAEFTVFNDQRVQSFSVNIGPGTPTALTFDPDNWLRDDHTEVGSISAPAPTILSAVNSGPGAVTVTWTPLGLLEFEGYRLYESADGQTSWSLVSDESTLTSGVVSTEITGLAEWQSLYLRLSSVNASLEESGFSDVLGVRVGPDPLLIVDGYDRWPSQSGGVNHDFIADHGRAVSAHGTPFDSCANEAVGRGVDLTDHGIVIWMCGDESTICETISVREQRLLTAFLKGGGKLFVTGNEIGWDISRESFACIEDRDFFGEYLRADYVANDSGDYAVSGTGGSSCFGAHAFSFGDGGDSPYLPASPDVIAASGSTVALEYSPGIVAGIQHSGLFGAGSTPGMLVHLGFAFETVYPENARLQMMDDVLTWFGAPVPAELSVLEAR